MECPTKRHFQSYDFELFREANLVSIIKLDPEENISRGPLISLCEFDAKPPQQLHTEGLRSRAVLSLISCDVAMSTAIHPLQPLDLLSQSL